MSAVSSVLSAFGRRHHLVSFGLFLLLGFHVGVWAVQIGSLVAALRLDPGRLGVALSGAAAGGILTLFAGGRIADRFGRRTILCIGFGASGLAFGWLALAHDFTQVAAAIVLYGLSISFVDLGSNAVGSDYEHEHRVEALTGLQAGFSLGAVVGAIGSAVLLTCGVDYRWVYAGLGLVFLVSAAISTRVGLPVRVDEVGEADAEPRPSGGVWRSPGVLFATVVVLVTFFGDGALEGFLAVFLRDALASGVLLSGVGIASFHLASFTGRSIAGTVQQRFGTGRIITAAGLLAAAGMTIAVVAPVAWVSIGGMLLVGFAISPVIPSALSLAGRSAPGRAGSAVAFTTAVGYTSFLLSPLAVGAIASATSLRIGLAVVIVTAIGIAVLGFRWPQGRADDPLQAG